MAAYLLKVGQDSASAESNTPDVLQQIHLKRFSFSVGLPKTI